MKNQAIPHTIQDDLGTERKINGLIESLPSSMCKKRVSPFPWIKDIFPMTTVLFLTTYAIFIARWTFAFLLLYQ